MKKYAEPNALIISVVAEDIMNGSWNLSDSTDAKAIHDMQIDVNDMWG